MVGNYTAYMIKCQRLILSIGMLLMFFVSASAQTFFNSTHIPVFHQQYEQPAFMGRSSEVRILGAFRYQWVGIEGAPMTVYAGADMPLPLKNVSGGVFVAHDRVGATSFTNAHVSLAYSIPFKENKISIGAKLGFSNMTLDGSKLVTPNDQTGIEDPTLYLEKESGIRPEIGAGVAFVHKYFEFGVYIHNLANFRTTISGLEQDNEFDFGRYVGVGGSGNIPLGRNFSLQPTVLFKTNTIQHQIDLSASATYKEKYSIGLGYRGYNKLSNESLALISKIKVLKGLSVMYSYDFLLNRIQLASSGSHEVSLEYVFPKKFISNRSKIINHPRYL